MIAKGPVEEDLKRLNRLYQASLSGSDTAAIPIFYSKLAVLELSGWVEGSFDLIAHRATKRRLHTEAFKKKALDAIRQNHGLTYASNFIPMMIKIIGLPECEQLDRDPHSDGRASLLNNELGTLRSQRIKAAHVNLAQTTIAFDSPSVTIDRLQRIHPILRDMYRWFC